MKRRLKFNKEISGWFVDLPEWEGSHDDLQMVCGADTWLDILCQGEWYVWLTISDEPFDGANELKLNGVDKLNGEFVGSGTTYSLEKYIGIPYSLDMWLCDVTLFVFGKFPEIIYYK